MKTTSINSTGFIDWVKTTTSARWFALIASILCLAYYLLEINNGRAQMADFRVYYDAASSFLDGSPMYGEAFGVSSGYYKYSPFAALPFVPFAILPYAVAKTIYYIIITFCIVWFSLYLVWIISIRDKGITAAGTSKNWGWILAIISIFMADHLERELHLGNVNLFLLIAALLLFLEMKKGKTIFAGILFSILLLFKPHFLILLPYFIWKKQWKLLVTSFIAIPAGLILPALFKGWNTNLALLSQWAGAMKDHNVKLEESPNTIYGIANHFLLQHSGGLLLVLFLLFVTAALFLWLMIRNRKVLHSRQPQFIEYFLLIALIPNLAHTDTEHFMWTWPLIAFSIILLFLESLEKKWVYIVFLILAFIPYCLNSPDIVGSRLRYLFDEGGLLGVANLVIVCISVILYVRISQKKMALV